MIEGKLKVFSVGTDWFIDSMEQQDIEVLKVKWSPPIEMPKDIASILEKIGAK